MGISFPGESNGYRAARDRLLEQEIELRRAMEAVAAARRELPPGGVVPEDYVFQAQPRSGEPVDVRFSELFAAGKDSLVIYSMMFPALRTTTAGPSGRANSVAAPGGKPLPVVHRFPRPARRTGWARVSARQPRRRRESANRAPYGVRRRAGWRRLRLLSSAGNTYNRDYWAETGEGDQQPMLNVFHRDGPIIRHFWGSELFYAPEDPEQDPRHVGTLEPLWNLFDLTPEGRGTDWFEQMSY